MPPMSLPPVRPGSSALTGESISRVTRREFPSCTSEDGWTLISLITGNSCPPSLWSGCMSSATTAIPMTRGIRLASRSFRKRSNYRSRPPWLRVWRALHERLGGVLRVQYSDDSEQPLAINLQGLPLLAPVSQQNWTTMKKVLSFPTRLDVIMESMFFSAIRKRSVVLGALLLLFSIACSSEVGTTPTATPINEPAPTPNVATPVSADPPIPGTGNRIGDMAPNFTLTEVSTDQPVQLAGLTEQGRPVVLFFFTTW